MCEVVEGNQDQLGENKPKQLIEDMIYCLHPRLGCRDYAANKVLIARITSWMDCGPVEPPLAMLRTTNGNTSDSCGSRPLPLSLSRAVEEVQDKIRTPSKKPLNISVCCAHNPGLDKVVPVDCGHQQCRDEGSCEKQLPPLRS